MDKPISQIIKEKREELGFSIEKVSETIFIPSKFLRYIEQEKWNKFPSQTHLKGFLKNYLSFLHIPVDIINQYPEIFSESDNSQTEFLEPQYTETENIYYVSTGKKIFRSIIVFIILILCIIVFIHIFKQKSKLPKSSLTKQILLIIMDKPNTKTKNKKSLSFSLKAAENVWVQAKSNNKIIFEKILTRGEKENLKGEKIFLRIGNAGGLIILYNGKTFGPFGKKGEVKNIIIDKTFFKQ
ncbi:MAG: DUF4115 domain-containing protein [Candidatus Omnitrophica bacterium]|nr:DUF4115 domain-containing protein [Candidatus Omnitrophota bacterium]